MGNFRRAGKEWAVRKKRYGGGYISGSVANVLRKMREQEFGTWISEKCGGVGVAVNPPAKSWNRSISDCHLTELTLKLL